MEQNTKERDNSEQKTSWIDAKDTKLGLCFYCQLGDDEPPTDFLAHQLDHYFQVRFGSGEVGEKTTIEGRPEPVTPICFAVLLSRKTENRFTSECVCCDGPHKEAEELIEKYRKRLTRIGQVIKDRNPKVVHAEPVDSFRRAPTQITEH